MTPRTITLILNDRCPLRCAHCSLGYSEVNKGTNETMDQMLIESVISLAQGQGYDMVVLAGGEPSLAPGLVNTAVTACRTTGIKSALVTAPVWAQTESSSDKFLARIQLPDYLILSFDRFHLEQLTRLHYVNAVKSAERKRLNVAFNVCSGDIQEEQKYREIIESDFPNLAGVYYSRVMPKGNAAELYDPAVLSGLSAAKGLDHIERTCTIGNCVVNKNGQLHGCCWSGDVSNSPLLFADDASRLEAFRAMHSSSRFLRLRSQGFIGSLTPEGKNLLLRQYGHKGYKSECAFCIAAMEDGIFCDVIGEGSLSIQHGN